MRESAYAGLKATFARICNITYAAEALEKDAETVLAPGSQQDRVNQMIALSEVKHDILCDPRTAAQLDAAETDSADLSPEDRRNLQLMRREWVHEASLPARLAGEAGRIGAEGVMIHTANYKTGDWDAVKDWYAHSFSVFREVGEAKKEFMGLSSAYEALMDKFSPGLRIDLVDNEFAALDTTLGTIIPEAMTRQKALPPALPLTGPFPREQQIALNHALANMVGFDSNRGILYAIEGHPSSTGSPDDSRITTRINDSDVFDAIFKTLHEAGHAIYTQNTPVEWRYQPAGEHMGMAVHESQSMLVEYHACMNEPFIGHMSAVLRDTFNRANDPALSPDNLKRILWRTQPSFIRILADEMTFPLHVLLRYDIEKGIIDGKFNPADIPELWNEGMKKRLGIVPPSPAQGCMQDVHWPSGLIGYFPSYTLGAMGAAQFFAAATKADPSILPEIGRGNFQPLNAWLIRNVHAQGSLLDADTLFTRATGTTLNAEAYMNHLRARYLGQPAAP